MCLNVYNLLLYSERHYLDTPITEIEGIALGSFEVNQWEEVQENPPDMMYIVTYHVANMIQSRNTAALEY